MRGLLSTYGSRGNVEPLVATGVLPVEVTDNRARWDLAQSVVAGTVRTDGAEEPAETEIS